MDFIDQQKQDIKAGFALRRRRQFLVAGVVILAGAAFVFGDELGFPGALAESSFFGVAICAVVFSLFNWRCPACSKYLGKSISHSFCPRCGIALR